MKELLTIAGLVATGNLAMAALEIMMKAKPKQKAQVSFDGRAWLITVDGSSTGRFDCRERAERVARMNGYSLQ